MVGFTISGIDSTFELVQRLDGRTRHLDFVDEHGDGVQHIGFRTPDVRAVVDNAVKDGGRTLARLDPDGNAEVQLSPGASVQAIVDMLPGDGIAYLDPGMGGVQLLMTADRVCTNRSN